MRAGLLSGLLFLEAAAACGGGSSVLFARYVATTGEVFHGDMLGGVTQDVALKASAASDLKCPPDQVRTSSAGRSQYLGEGCGQRVLYHAICADIGSDRPDDGDGHDTAPVDPRDHFVCRIKMLSRTTLDH